MTLILGPTAATPRPGFQVSAAPRHRPYWRPSVRTIAPEAPTFIDEAAKITLMGNLGVISLLKICETSVKKTKKLMVSFFSEHLNKKGAYFYLYKATNSTGRKEMKLPSF